MLEGFNLTDIEFAFTNIARKKCQCCGKDLVYANRQKGLKGSWHAHHINPKSQGIDNSIENCAILCIDCHTNCVHTPSHREHYLPQDWGKNHDLRRCWGRTKNGQCLIQFSVGKRRAYCKKHK
jgi:hypothetical protein